MQGTPGGRYYYLFDGLGSVVAMTTRYSYDPYGQITSSSGTVANPWKFGGAYGAYTDASTGLVKIGQRSYDPALGRWTQRDPLPTGNRYTYVGGNPVNKIDPAGLQYVDTNITTGSGVGLTGGFVYSEEGAAGYFGGGLTIPGIGGSITYSSQDITPGLNIGLQVGVPGTAAQIGYSFGEGGGFFGEVGIGAGVGVSLMGYYVGEPR